MVRSRCDNDMRGRIKFSGPPLIFESMHCAFYLHRKSAYRANCLRRQCVMSNQVPHFSPSLRFMHALSLRLGCLMSGFSYWPSCLSHLLVGGERLFARRGIEGLVLTLFLSYPFPLFYTISSPSSIFDTHRPQ